MERHEVIARNIRMRRNELGLTQVEVAEASGLSLDGYRKIETALTVEPRMNSLVSIAGVLKMGVMQLFEEPRTLVSVRFRAQKKLRVREKLIDEMARWLSDFEYLERLLGEQREFKLSGLAHLLRTYTGSMPKPIVAAERARKALELDEDEPIQDVIGLLEWAGVKVRMSTYTNDGFFGLSGWGKSYSSPGIVVCENDTVQAERKIFSAVHELGHLVLHRDDYNIQIEEENDEHEREADQFASHFLMPSEQFLDKWEELRGKQPYDRVMIIKKVFNVSYKAVLKRLEEIGAVDYGDAQRYIFFLYRRRHGSKLPGKREPYSVGEEYPFVARRLDNLVRKAIERDLISVGRGAAILGISLQEMHRVIQDWDWATVG